MNDNPSSVESRRSLLLRPMRADLRRWSSWLGRARSQYVAPKSDRVAPRDRERLARHWKAMQVVFSQQKYLGSLGDAQGHAIVAAERRHSFFADGDPLAISFMLSETPSEGGVVELLKLSLPRWWSAFPIGDRVGPSALGIPTPETTTNLQVGSATGGELVLRFLSTNGCSAAGRDAVLRRLHHERQALVARKREGCLPKPDVDCLRDIEREIDRVELAEETERSARHPAWPKLEKLLERVLELQAEYGEGSSRDKL